ncbi:hypothetical protein JQN58_11935 [Aneurinibacillus sp. BA2021]|nr:hypothetical protein [Aneurinibacillus sp. BA2021]
MLDLLEAVFHAVALFFRILYRLLFNPLTDLILGIWELLTSRNKKKKMDKE